MNYDDYKLMTPPQDKECPECEGRGHFKHSACCSARISEAGICYECREHTEQEDCEECNGTGIRQ
jgi:hypothetical protein